MLDPAEVHFRQRMRELAVRGGGGAASAASRRATIAGTRETAIGEARIAEPINTSAKTPRVSERRPITMDDVLADRKRLGPYRPEKSERQRMLDAISEEHTARFIAQIRRQGDEPEPFDPWS